MGAIVAFVGVIVKCWSLRWRRGKGREVRSSEWSDRLPAIHAGAYLIGAQ
jgi:hypothetical protein